MKKQSKPGELFNKSRKKKANWIQSIGIKKDALHRELGVPKGKKIPSKKLASATKKGGKLGKRARLAETLKSFHKGKKTKKKFVKKSDHDADDVKKKKMCMKKHKHNKMCAK